MIEGLRIPAALFGAVLRARSAFYRWGWLPVVSVPVPVVSVGNLSTGGVGKTPLVRWLAEDFCRRGLKPSVLSRGYRARVGERSDEGRELLADWPDLLHVERPDRVHGALELIDRGAEVIVLDDGFQHRRLARDLDLVLVDATRPWGLPAPRGGGDAVCALLPRGLLREAPSALTRAHALVLTRTDQVSQEELAALRGKLEGLAPGVPCIYGTHRPWRLRRLHGPEIALQDLQGREVWLASAIGNSQAFERSAAALGAHIAGHTQKRDHSAWQRADFSRIPAQLPLLVTAKDAVKLGDLEREAWVLQVRFQIGEGRECLESLLAGLPAAPGTLSRAALHAGLVG